MEFIFVIIFVVYSIWAEANKKKKEDVDIDFSELSSLDDFFKQDSTGGDKRQPKKKAPSRSHQGRVAEPALASRRQDYKSKAVSASDILQSMTGKGNYASGNRVMQNAEHSSAEGVTRTAAVNYDRPSTIAANQAHAQEVATEHADDQGFAAAGFTLNSGDLAKSIILTEVLQRYDLTRIYSRIPEFKDED